MNDDKSFENPVNTPFVIKFIIFVAFCYSLIQLYDLVVPLFKLTGTDITFSEVVAYSLFPFFKFLLGSTSVYFLLKRHIMGRILFSVICFLGFGKVSSIFSSSVGPLSELSGNELDKAYGSMLGYVLISTLIVFLVSYTWFSNKSKKHFNV